MRPLPMMRFLNPTTRTTSRFEFGFQNLVSCVFDPPQYRSMNGSWSRKKSDELGVGKPAQGSSELLPVQLPRNRLSAIG